MGKKNRNEWTEAGKKARCHEDVFLWTVPLLVLLMRKQYFATSRTNQNDGNKEWTASPQSAHVEPPIATYIGYWTVQNDERNVYFFLLGSVTPKSSVILLASSLHPIAFSSGDSFFPFQNLQVLIIKKKKLVNIFF